MKRSKLVGDQLERVISNAEKLLEIASLPGQSDENELVRLQNKQKKLLAHLEFMQSDAYQDEEKLEYSELEKFQFQARMSYFQKVNDDYIYEMQKKYATIKEGEEALPHKMSALLQKGLTKSSKVFISSQKR